jgi:hypothetical protein
MVTTLTSLSETLTLTGQGSYTGASGLGQAAGSLNVPGGLWSAMQAQLTFGSGSGQANQVYIAQRTVAAAADDNLGLNGGGLLSPVGDVIAFTKVKLILVAIEAPDGTKKLNVGPNGVANAAPLSFGGVAAGAYKVVTNWEVIALEPVAGYTITPATSFLLPIHNPGTGSVTYDVLVLGIG